MELVRGKENIVHTLLVDAVNTDDAVLLDFTLKKCWNKAKVFSIVDMKGDNFLHESCRKGYTNCSRVLIENGIDINIRGSNCNTALHYAVLYSRLSIICQLFEAGANPFLEDHNGKQPFELAKTQEIKEKLRQYTIKCSEIKLIKNLTVWKRVVHEEEQREQLIKAKLKEFEENRRLSYQSSTSESDVLQRCDSGILSDADSEKSVDQLISAIPRYSEMFSHHKKEQKSIGVRSFSTVVRRANSGPANSEETEVSASAIKSHGLKVSSLYSNIRRTPLNRRKKKMDRTQRMSMPDLPTFGSPESYI